MDVDEEYEVEKVLDSRLRYRRVHYRVKWVGYDEEDLSWYDADGFQNSAIMLCDFHQAHPEKKAPRKALEEWLRLCT